MKPFTKLLLIFAVVVFAVYSMKTPVYETIIFIVCLAFAFYKTAHLPKMSVFLLYLLLFMLAELIVTTVLDYFVYGQYTGFTENIWYFSFSLIINLCICLYCRRSALYFLREEPKLFDMANSLFYVFMLFCFVDLYALGENFIRNLERLGFPEDQVRHLWEITHMYYNIEIYKSILIGLASICLFASVYAHRSEEALPVEQE
ncbi:hypothetical protein [Pseudoalteromonas luteoviolacea]|uniref:Uncharacterized protein n=1 Tax=Pseudoalteromonas luteoviolacea H33 TaxID=1365251 RepID=A0A167FU18_9GAMM|nr:hypothetical protein [Pseudoalteromonas luteoviolacea]KZN52982.1 hypothetical protein N476_09360 [Pseudoalteromonas luteoviolacea H33]KZN78101.1 hypothetical protein N477_10705 [Pseudoalteromonas luteoviolacea H33-S]